MEESNKKIEKLDFILAKLIQSKVFVGSNDLHASGKYDEYNDDINKIKEDFSDLQSEFYKANASEKLAGQDDELICYCPKTTKFKREYGGFVNYYLKLKESKLKRESESIKDQNRQDDKDEIDRYKLEEFKYKKEIRRLEEEIKISSLLKNYWWLIISAIGVGTAIGRFLV